MKTTVSFVDLLGRMLRFDRLRHTAGFLVLLLCFLSTTPSASESVAIPPGVWLFDKKVALQIYNCSNLLCGRILWLKIPRDKAGDLVRDKNNPDPSLRSRELCGLTIITGLKPLGNDLWGGGRFYNPDDGKTYHVAAQLVSDDRIVARLFERVTFFGQDKTLERVSRGTTDGWC